MSYKIIRAVLWALDAGTNFWIRNAILTIFFAAAAILVVPSMQGKAVLVQLAAAIIMAFMIILSYAAVIYFLLSQVDSLVTLMPDRKMTVVMDLERAKAKVVKSMVEKEFDFSLNPVNQYSPGMDEGVFSEWRKKITTIAAKPPFIAVSKDPFIVLKITETKNGLEKISREINPGTSVEILAIFNTEDTKAQSFLKYLETSMRGATRASQ